jgi:2-(1,2-epoxy-1,2-dihydrophenyl)acetyl-CoA isomerase
MSWLLPRLVGMRRAQEIILTDRRILAEEAAHIGMVTRLVAAEGLLDSGMEVARALCKSSGVAIQGARALLGSSFQNALPEQLDAEARTIVAVSRSDLAKRRMAAMSARQNS